MRIAGPFLFGALWAAFFIYWRLMAMNVKSAQRLEPPVSRILRLVLLVAGITLLSWGSIPGTWLHAQVLPDGAWRFWGGLAVTAAGLLFAVWARIHLGRNWSSAVTLKRDHELITSGPYALVRHPIYTGILTGLLGSALAVDEVRGVLAVAIFAIAFWTKLRLEENWMRSQFGETYAAYSSRVAALVPFVL